MDTIITPPIGYWGPVTSSIDWCEENYSICSYIAEFWNTITNAIFIIYALVGMWSVIKFHYEHRFFWANFGLMCIGIGSWAFHSTLQYEMQLADELPMIYTCCIVAFCIYEISNHKTYRPYITIILWLVALLFTILYTGVIFWPWFQHGLTGVLIGIIIFRCVYIMRKALKIAKNYKEKGMVDKEDVKELDIMLQIDKHKHTLKGILYISVLTYALAFLLWNIDNIYCQSLSSLRISLGSPWKHVFQLHGWWHIFTGIGTYSFFIYNTFLRNIYCGYKTTCIKWKFFCIPYVAHYEKDIKVQ